MSQASDAELKRILASVISELPEPDGVSLAGSGLIRPNFETGQEFKMETKPVLLDKRGGARDGAGRKPKALKYAVEVAQAEEKIIAALPSVIESLIDAARAGDVAAARYLMDRVFGRVQLQEAPPAEDRSLPMDEDDVEVEINRRETARIQQQFMDDAYKPRR